VGRAFLGLALRKLEEGPGPSEPVLEAFGGVVEAVGQGDALGNGRTIKRKERVELVVDQGDLLAGDGPDEGLVGILALVQMVVAEVPLGAGGGLEVHGQQFDGMAALVAFGGLLLGAEVRLLEGDPVLVEEPVKERMRAEAGLLVGEGPVRWSERGKVARSGRVDCSDTGKEQLA
jgi:hypothetical protein